MITEEQILDKLREKYGDLGWDNKKICQTFDRKMAVPVSLKELMDMIEGVMKTPSHSVYMTGDAFVMKAYGNMIVFSGQANIALFFEVDSS